MRIELCYNIYSPEEKKFIEEGYMRLKHYIFYSLVLIVYIIPFIPMEFKGILGFVFILASSMLMGFGPAMITAAIGIGMSLLIVIPDTNYSSEVKISLAIVGSFSYIALAWFLGRFSSSLKNRNLELGEEIEKRKKAEKELSEKLTQLQSLLDTIPNPIFFKDLNFRYIGSNPAFQEYMGLSEEEIIGKTTGEIVDPCLAGKCKATDENLLAGLGKQSFEEEVRLADGSKRNIIFNKDIFRDANQNTIGIVGVMTDITDKLEAVKLKQSIIENKKKIDEIIENDKIKTEFFSNVSHEFRTPLNVILGSLQLIELYLTANQYAVSREKVIKKVAVLKQNSYRLLRLVNNLIDISRIDAKAFEMHFRNYDIISLIRNITLSVAVFTGNEGIDVTFETDIDNKMMACDDEKIERVLLNLLSNAIKFTPKGGKISVGIFNKPDGLCIKVEDNGIGIPADKQDQIFQRFCQIDRIFTRQHEGSGVGLNLVKSLVELHGGTITFVSKVGIGTSFVIYLPNNEIDVEALRYNIIGEQTYSNKISVEFSDIYSIGRQ
jgi:PAS domain S-box-containing protein